MFLVEMRPHPFELLSDKGLEISPLVSATRMNGLRKFSSYAR